LKIGNHYGLTPLPYEERINSKECYIISAKIITMNLVADGWQTAADGRVSGRSRFFYVIFIGVKKYIHRFEF